MHLETGVDTRAGVAAAPCGSRQRRRGCDDASPSALPVLRQSGGVRDCIAFWCVGHRPSASAAPHADSIRRGPPRFGVRHDAARIREPKPCGRPAQLFGRRRQGLAWPGTRAFGGNHTPAFIAQRAAPATTGTHGTPLGHAQVACPTAQQVCSSVDDRARSAETSRAYATCWWRREPFGSLLTRSCWRGERER